jgi:hypothetical protein
VARRGTSGVAGCLSGVVLQCLLVFFLPDKSVMDADPHLPQRRPFGDSWAIGTS